MTLDENLLKQGLERHRAGDVVGAVEIYRRLLVADPQQPQLHNLLGAAALAQGRFDEAAVALAEALRLDPRLAAAHDNYGLLCLAGGRFAEAIDSLRRANELNPVNRQTRMNLALALVRGEQTAEAVAVLRQATEQTPGDPLVHYDLGVILAGAARRPEAIAAFEQAARLSPDLAEACVNLSGLHLAERAALEAERWARRATELRDELPPAHYALGRALVARGDPQQAIASFERALQLDPHLSGARHDLGVALLGVGRSAEAIVQYRQVLAARPDDPETLYNLGNAYLKQGDVAAARDSFAGAVRGKPAYAEARHNLGAMLLLHGELAQGFAEYEWRFRSRDYPPTWWPWSLWTGEPLAGRTLVLCPEQGFGDTLQFVRYAPRLKELGARVAVACTAAQRPVLERTPGIDAFVTLGGDLGPADFYLPVMSLPARLGTTLETIPRDVPYVFAEPERVERWRARLAAIDGFKVGLVWQGNPERPGDAERSIPLERFAPLAAVPGVRLINLQHGAGIEQLAAVGDAWRVVAFPGEVDVEGAFLDTAAIMRNLDLVITSDTSAAHLAGALGVETWVALQRVPDWRFMLEREDSPWYPTMRLFRQRRAGDWPEVFERIAGELGKRGGPI